MTVPLEPLARALGARTPRLAVFDIGLRQQTGQWQLAHRVPLAEAIERFEEHAGFSHGDDQLMVPLHEDDTAELTDEFVLVDGGASPMTVTFLDLDRGARRTLPLRDIETAYPAWRMRFWTGQYAPPSEPSYVGEFGDDSDAPAAGNVAPARAQPDTLLDDARAALESERRALRGQRREAFERLPVEEYVDRYGGLQGLHPAGRETDDFGQQTVVLERHPEDDAPGTSPGVRAGDVIVIDSPEVAAFPVEGEVFDISDGVLTVGIYWDTAAESGAEGAFAADDTVSMTVGRLVDGERFASIEAALGTVERTDHARARYVGGASVTFGEEVELAAGEPSLNRDQRTAVRRILATDGLALVQTPPGTGVRRIVWTAIRETVAEGGRVAVFCPDERATTTLLEGGAGQPLGERAANAGIRLDRCGPEDPPSIRAEVVVGPLSAAAVVDDHEYDLAILDQGASVSVPAGAIPFAKGGRVAVLGDPEQSYTTRTDGPLAPSIYEHLAEAYGPAIVHRVRCQYRMNQAIALFPDREWYDGDLIHGQETRERTIEGTAPLVAYQIPGKERITPTGSAYNDAAVTAVLEEIADLTDRGIPGSEIGVLTPASAELGKIRATIQDASPDLARAVTVGGLGAFRCETRSVMIVSFVRGGDDVDAFWTGPGLNAAITAAERRLTLIGDWETIAGDPPAAAAGRLAGFLDERGLIHEPPE